MHHDFFAWVRLILFFILILAFVLWGTYAESKFRMEQPEPEDPVRKEPIYIAQAISQTIPPTEAEAAPVPTLRHPLTEITPVTEPPHSPTEPPTETWKSLGIYELTAYCSCEICCGEYARNRPTDENGNPIVYTSIGAVAKAGTTIAVDPRVIPYGSEIQIDGHTYIAQDTGGAIKGNRIDVYHSDHMSALEFGVQYAEVLIKVNSK